MTDREADRNRKRAAFARETATRRPWLLPALGGLVLVVLLLVLNLASGGRGTLEGPASPAPTARAIPVAAVREGKIRITLSDLDSGRAQFFVHNAPASRIPFFGVKSSDGEYRVALDACAVCYQGRRGYTQIGQTLVCNKCGRSFPPEVIDQVGDGCHPISIPRQVVGQELVIHTADLERIDSLHAAAPVPSPSMVR